MSSTENAGAGGQHQEIERKFVVERTPEGIERRPHKRMRQGYLVIDDERKLTVRLRQEGDDFRLAIKHGKGMVRTEVELPLDRPQFEALWPEAEGRSLEKTRYYIENDVRVEVDIYEGRLDGLVTAEVEFESEEAARSFAAPPWLGREVTGDARYLNQNLVRHGRPE